MSIRKGQVIVAGAGNTRRNIGEVYYSQSSLATDNSGALPLWTGEIVATAMYPSLTEWVTKHTELQCTAEEYESALSTYGECPKYVISADFLRLPKLANYIKMANGIDGVTQKEAGLPNITGSVSGVRAGAWKAEGALKAKHTSTTSQTMTNHLNQNDLTVELDASLSSAVYGNSDTVTPTHTTLYPWVYAYSSAIEASVAQAAEFQQGLSGKADLDFDNVPESGKEVVVSWGRNFVNTNQTVASGTDGIAGTYDLGFTDGKVRIGVFSCSISTSRDGFSNMEIKTDIVANGCAVAGTNNGFAAQSTATIPFVNSVSISFPSTGARISSASVKLVGYFE